MNVQKIMGMFSLGLLLLAGCPTRSPSTAGPQDIVAAYARAIEAGEFEQAYGMMSLDYRKQFDQKSFIRTLRRNPAEMKFILRQLRNKARQVTIAASLEIGANEQLQLINEEGRWRIATDPLDFYPQQSPAQALRSFVRAIENKRYDIVLRFVPSQRAETLTVELLKKYFEGEEQEEARTLVRGLKANLNAPIHKTGDVATMPYGERDVVKFVREDGLWKVENPH